MKNFFTLIALAFSSFMLGQIGIGTPTPRGALDLNRPLTNTFGLVLPTNASTANILNPQGGTVADGTMIYDSAMKCVKVFMGNNWSDCLADTQPTTVLAANCGRTGFEGVYTSKQRLIFQTYKATITNNGLTTLGPIYFHAGDLVLSGVDGITVSAVSPTSSFINAGQSITVTYTLSGTPITDGTLKGDWSKFNMNCKSDIEVGLGVRMAYWKDDSIGNRGLIAFNDQLENPAYYGFNGIYSGNFSGFIFTDITNTLANLSAQELINNYDIISIGPTDMNATEAKKIKDYVDGGGVAVILLSNSIGTILFNEFGGTGSIGNAQRSTITVGANNITNGIFGTSGRAVINASYSDRGRLIKNNLPSGATVLAGASNYDDVFITGSDNRAIFFSSFTFFQHSDVKDTIDTAQETFLHNIMAYALQKAGF